MERGVIYCEEIVNLFHAHYTVGYYTVDGWLIGWSVSPPPPPPPLKKTLRIYTIHVNDLF